VAGPRIRIKLRAYDHRMLDVAAREIVDRVLALARHPAATQGASG